MTSTTTGRRPKFNLHRDDPLRQAQQWRAAAEASAQQFPHDTARRDYYLAEAKRLETAA